MFHAMEILFSWIIFQWNILIVTFKQRKVKKYFPKGTHVHSYVQDVASYTISQIQVTFEEFILYCMLMKCPLLFLLGRVMKSETAAHISSKFYNACTSDTIQQHYITIYLWSVHMEQCHWAWKLTSIDTYMFDTYLLSSKNFSKTIFLYTNCGQQPIK